MRHENPIRETSFIRTAAFAYLSTALAFATFFYVDYVLTEQDNKDRYGDAFYVEQYQAISTILEAQDAANDPRVSAALDTQQLCSTDTVCNEVDTITKCVDKLTQCYTQGHDLSYSAAWGIPSDNPSNAAGAR